MLSASYLNLLTLPIRTVIAFFLALAIVILSGPRFIKALQILKFGQPVRTDGPESHFKKNGTPTMGGIMIIVAVVISTLLTASLSNVYVWLCLLVFLGYGLVGFLDDYLKIKRKNSNGLSVIAKYSLLSLVSLLAVLSLYYLWHDTYRTSLSLFFYKTWTPQLGFILFVALGYFCTVGSSNAVNLTDGLDGLSIIPVCITILGLGTVAVFAGIPFAEDFGLIFIPGATELAVIGAAVIGAGIGFYWYNSYPAQVFMGDVGSLALGGLIGFMAVIIRQEILLILLGLVFVLEAASVIIQTFYFKYTKRKTGTGKRVFLMTPIHHHFEKLGWPETKVVARAYVLSLVCFLLSMVFILTPVLY